MAEENRYTKEQLEEMIAELSGQLILIKSKEPKLPVKTASKETMDCDICGGRYTLSNKSIHNKTRMHKNEIQHMKDLRRIARAKTLDGRTG